jgi:hypothetical protein
LAEITIIFIATKGFFLSIGNSRWLLVQDRDVILDPMGKILQNYSFQKPTDHEPLESKIGWTYL